MSLRAKVVSDLEITMEKGDHWGLPVVLISPTGLHHPKFHSHDCFAFDKKSLTMPSPLSNSIALS